MCAKNILEVDTVVKGKEKSMKILIYNDLVYGGGVETLLRSFTSYFVKKGYNVTVIASPPNTDDFIKAFPTGVHCFRARIPRKNYDHFCFRYLLNQLNYKIHRVFFRLKMFLKTYDIVIAFKSIYIKEVLPFRAKRKYAWVHSDHRSIHDKSWFKKIFPNEKKELEYLNRYYRIVCVSETAKEGIVKTVGDTGNLCVLYNPIDIEKIIKLADQESKFFKDMSKKLLVSTGRLDSDKNYMMLLETCLLLNNKLSFELWIIGDGPQRKELEEYINVNKLSNVHLLGFQDNPYPIMKQADLFISSSINETYGLAIQEAIILGVPVIAVKCSGVEEAFDTEYGVLTDNSAESLSCEIYRILNNMDLYNNFKRNIEEKYPLNQVYNERFEKICELLEKADD